jgi:hypothetical protein
MRVAFRVRKKRRPVRPYGGHKVVTGILYMGPTPKDLHIV